MFTKEEALIKGPQLAEALKSDLSGLVDGCGQAPRDVFNILIEETSHSITACLSTDEIRPEVFEQYDTLVKKRLCVYWAEHDISSTLDEFLEGADEMRGYIHKRLAHRSQ